MHAYTYLAMVVYYLYTHSGLATLIRTYVATACIYAICIIIFNQFRLAIWTFHA